MFNKVINAALAVVNLKKPNWHRRTFFSPLGVFVTRGPEDLNCDSYILFRISAEYKGKSFYKKFLFLKDYEIASIIEEWREGFLQKKNGVFFINAATVGIFDIDKNLNRIDFE